MQEIEKYIILLKYPLDVEYLNGLAEDMRSKAVSHVDSRYTRSFSEYKSVQVNNSYIKKITTDFNVNAKAKIYYQQPNYYLPMHIDNQTLCSLNFIIGDSSDLAPVTFEAGNVYYKQALLNTQVKHSVLNGPKERVLLKFSIFDLSFDELAKKLKYIV